MQSCGIVLMQIWLRPLRVLTSFANRKNCHPCTDAVSIANSCETRKVDDHELMTPDSSGSPVIASDVIVLNPVDDSVCNLQCAVGWYHLVYGNAVPFSCAAQTADRRSREGIPKYPISCTSAFTS